MLKWVRLSLKVGVATEIWCALTHGINNGTLLCEILDPPLSQNNSNYGVCITNALTSRHNIIAAHLCQSEFRWGKLNSKFIITTRMKISISNTILYYRGVFGHVHPYCPLPKITTGSSLSCCVCLSKYITNMKSE